LFPYEKLSFDIRNNTY